MNQVSDTIGNNTNDAIVTICSLNYLHKASVLLQSYKEFNSNDDLYLLIVDKKKEDLFTNDRFFNIIWVEDLFDETFFKYAFTFDVLEFNTNVKPAVLKKLLSTYDKVIYLDPDIQVFAEFTIIKQELNKSSIVVTPHYTKPINDKQKPNDLELLRFGAYNLGFVGVSKCEEAFTFLDWWGERCLEYGFYEPQSGLGVDQKWIDLAPSFFPNLSILRHQGLNVAFWNLHERILSKTSSTYYVNSEYPLLFFHFSSFSEDNPENIASKQSRFKKGSRKDIEQIFNDYSHLVKESEFFVLKNERYGFDFFDDGQYINPMLRRVFAILDDPEIKKENPFKASGKFRKYAQNKGLLKKKDKYTNRYTFKDINQFKKQELLIMFGLKIILKIMGTNRYFNFMRYLGHISSIRNQSKLFNRQ